MNSEFSDKVAIVTGGARGIGASICRSLVVKGVHVIVNYLNSEKAAKGLTEELQPLGSVTTYQADVSQDREARLMVEWAIANYGRIDYLINNASYSSTDLWKASLENISLNSLRKTFEVDVIGTLICCKEVAPYMKLQGFGRIVNITSSAAMLADIDTFAYNPAKAAVANLTKGLAKILAPYVLVNAIAPGSIRTHWLEEWLLSAEEISELSESNLLNRIGEPREVADAVCFLLSKQSSFITGQIIAVDGGFFG
jgi:3-oxoacyl-[acyl-carrier protein] reductase